MGRRFLEESNFDPLKDFFRRRALYHFKPYEFRNMRTVLIIAEIMF